MDLLGWHHQLGALEIFSKEIDGREGNYPVLLTALVILIGISFFAASVFYASRNVLLGWYCLLATNAFWIAFGSRQAMLGSLHLDPSDIVSLILLSAGLLRFSRALGSPGLFRILGSGFIAVFAFSLIRGMLLFGVIPVSNEGRSYIGELLSLLYFTSIPTDTVTIRKFVRAYLIFGSILVGIAILHYLGLNVGASYEAFAIDSAEVAKDRALPAAAAFSIALCFIFSIGWITHRRSRRFFAILPAVFVGMVVLLQHRTVWVVLLVCVTLLPFIDRAVTRRLIPIGILAGIIALCLALWVYGTSSTASNQFEDSTTNLGTWGWRVDTWDSLLSDDEQTFISVVAGRSMGTPMLHYDPIQRVYEEAPVHSEYVNLYMRAGIIGLVSFLVFLIRPVFLLFSERYRRSSLLFPSSSTWCLAIIAIIIYGVTYNFNSNAIPLVGVATALLLSPEHGPTAMLCDAGMTPRS